MQLEQIRPLHELFSVLRLNNSTCQVKDASQFRCGVFILLSFIRENSRVRGNPEESADPMIICCVPNWGSRCDVDHMISVYVNVHKRLQEHVVFLFSDQTLAVSRQGGGFFYPPALQILPSFLCLTVREFLGFFITVEILIRRKEDIPSACFIRLREDLKWGKRGKKCNTVGWLALFPCFTTNT